MQSVKAACPPLQFALFRILFGSYLAVHFLMLLPIGADIWSREGTLPDPSLNPTFGIFPNPLHRWDEPWMIQALLVTLALLSVAFALGVFRRTCALMIWLGWVFLFNRNNLIANPSLPYIGWLLLAMALVPTGEPLVPRLFRADGGAAESWRMPPVLYWGAWVLMGLGYTLSGLDKLGSPSWIDGSAMLHLLHNPLARDVFLRDLVLAAPALTLALAGWGALSLEIAFGPLCLVPALRKWVWLAMVGMHLGILTVVSFADLTAGMLMIHAFTFDARWVPDAVRLRIARLQAPGVRSALLVTTRT